MAPKRSGSSSSCAVVAASLVWLVASGCSSSSPDHPSGSGAAATTGGTGTGTSSGDWCSALSVFRAHCQECHAAQPLYGAPMPLVTFDNLHARSVTTPSKYVFEMVEQRIHDPKNTMPPPSANDTLAATQLAAIDAWVAGGALAGADPTCGGSTTGSSGPTGAGGATGSSGPTSTGAAGASSSSSGSTGGAGGTGAVGTGGAGGGPVGGWPADCEQRFKLVAHGKSAPGDTTKFSVSGAPTNQFYQCFFFKAPYAGAEVQALQFRPVLDDARVVHHWILYGSDTPTGTDGQVGGQGCSNGAFLAGWAPGGTGTDLPPDVGLQMPKGPNAMMALEIHYNNLANYTDALDASGVEFCTTTKFRTNTAAVHWLGTNAISIPAHATKDVVSTCDPASTQTAHVISVSPHMHQLGVHAKLMLNHKDGTQVALHDAPFAFSDQRIFPLDVLINDGDTLTTTCSYDNTTAAAVRFGPNTENEMCYNFVTAWPAGVLSGGGFLAQPNHCLSP